MSKKLAESLGEYLGEYIIKNLPSLSHDACTRNVIQVSIGEADEYRRLHDVLMSKIMDGVNGDNHSYSEKEWNDYLRYRYVLKEKYLPHNLRINIPYIDFSNEKVNKQIKDSLICTLWNWDFCDWSLKEEDVVFENETITYGKKKQYSQKFAYVRLKLGLEAPSSFTGDEWIEIKTPQKEI
jgi:hypothetical protein